MTTRVTCKCASTWKKWCKQGVWLVWKEITASACKQAYQLDVINVTFDPPVSAAGVAKCADNVSLIRVFPCPQIQISCCLLALVCHHTSSHCGKQTGEATTQFIVKKLMDADWIWHTDAHELVCEVVLLHFSSGILRIHLVSRHRCEVFLISLRSNAWYLYFKQEVTASHTPLVLPIRNCCYPSRLRTKEVGLVFFYFIAQSPPSLPPPKTTQRCES